MQIKPQIVQLHSVNATLPEFAATPDGDMKIPEPGIFKEPKISAS